MLCSLMGPVVLCESIGDWKAALWSPIRQVAENAEGEGESSQFAEVKAIQLHLDIVEQEKWYGGQWMK